MFNTIYRVVKLFVILNSVENAVADITLDYYFGDADRNLRTDKPLLGCNSKELKRYCNNICGPVHACLLGKCFCMDENDSSHHESDPHSHIPEQIDIYIDFEDDTDITTTTQALPPLEYFEPKPVLRHHIAHFCPNLDVARDCIRKCMEVGKPAFCGKDHVCYCGHKYDYPVEKDKNGVNPADAYKEFHDMYEKYFGPKDKTPVNTGPVQLYERANEKPVILSPLETKPY